MGWRGSCSPSVNCVMTASVSQLFADPRQFACGLNVRQDELCWTQADAADLASATFLDQRFVKDRPVQSISLGRALDHHRIHSRRAPRASYIFHTSFSCSTLLAKCIDRSGAALALKEPGLLFDIAQHRRQPDGTNGSPALQNLLCLADRLLAQVGEHQPVVIKPTNAANNLLAPLLSLPEAPQVLLLHGKLRDFLVSVAKYGTRSRLFARQLFQSLRHDVDVVGRTRPEAAMMMTDLQIAAAAWFGQIQLFHQVARTPDTAVATLSTPAFLADRVAALGAVCEHFGLRLAPQKLALLQQSGLLDRDAKFENRSFNTDQRRAEAEKVEERHGEEIDETVAWLESTTPSRRLVQDLESRSVLATAPPARRGPRQTVPQAGPEKHEPLSS